MSLRDVGIIFRKELTDVLRDRRTLGFMVALPILVIPGMMWLMGNVMESGVERLRQEISIIAVHGADQAPNMVELLRRLESAGDDQSHLLALDDPLLRDGLLNMLTAAETEDVTLAREQAESAQSDERKEKLGAARFLQVVDFAPAQPPAFLADGARLRLLSSASKLAQLGDSGLGLASPEVENLLRDDPFLAADRQRLADLRESQRERLNVELGQLEALRAEIGAGIAARTYHAVVVFHDNFGDTLHRDGTARYSILYDDSQEKSRMARHKVTGLLERLSTGIVRARVTGHNLYRTLLNPIDGNSLNVGRERNFLAVLLPYVCILMCFLGAIYPAIDLGAGEKERQTLETLLVTPASRFELVLGKYLVVTLAAMTAAMLNIASLVASYKLGIIDGPGMAALQLDPRAIGLTALLMLPVAALFAAVLLAVSIFAKSFKEAQSYSTPLNFAVIIPALFSFIPGIELTRGLALVPLVSVSLALKEAWAGIFEWDCIALIVASSAVYAMLALLFCVRWFEREEVLFRT